jgi:hypothetical protein
LRQLVKLVTAVVVCAMPALPDLAAAQTAQQFPRPSKSRRALVRSSSKTVRPAPKPSRRCTTLDFTRDPKPTVELIKKTLKIYPYTPGGYGDEHRNGAEGKVRRLEVNPPLPPTKFVEASGKSFNTIPPSDYSFFEMINANIQQELADSYNPEVQDNWQPLAS